jgi:hypothetical protein
LASTRTIPADERVLNEISAHVQRFGTGPGGVIMTNRVDTYGHPFPDAEDLGRGAIDAVFAVALTEQGRNHDAN